MAAWAAAGGPRWAAAAPARAPAAPAAARWRPARAARARALAAPAAAPPPPLAASPAPLAAPAVALAALALAARPALGARRRAGRPRPAAGAARAGRGGRPAARAAVARAAAGGRALSEATEPVSLVQFGGIQVTRDAARWLSEEQDKCGGSLEPTPIQAASMPAIREGRSVAMCAPTGTGKTLAYLLPLVERIKALEAKVQGGGGRAEFGPQVIVFVPFGDLLRQVAGVAREMLGTDATSGAVLEFRRNQTQLRESLARCSIMVVTPADLNDTLKLQGVRQKWMEAAARVRAVVVDEADSMVPAWAYVNSLAGAHAAREWPLGDMLEDIAEAPNRVHRDSVQLVAASASIDDTTLEFLQSAANVVPELVRAKGVDARFAFKRLVVNRVPTPDEIMMSEAHQRKIQKRRNDRDLWEDRAEELMSARRAALAADDRFAASGLDNPQDLTNPFVEPKFQRLEEKSWAEESEPSIRTADAPDNGLWPAGMRHCFVQAPGSLFNQSEKDLNPRRVANAIAGVVHAMAPRRCLAVLADLHAQDETDFFPRVQDVKRRITGPLRSEGYKVLTSTSAIQYSNPNAVASFFGDTSAAVGGSVGYFGSFAGTTDAGEVLVGSSKSLRGLDFTGCDMVIIVGELSSAREYMHIAGRTGRCVPGQPATGGTVVTVGSSRAFAAYRKWGRELFFHTPPEPMHMGFPELPDERAERDKSLRDALGPAGVFTGNEVYHVGKRRASKRARPNRGGPPQRGRPLRDGPQRARLTRD